MLYTLENVRHPTEKESQRKTSSLLLLSTDLQKANDTKLYREKGHSKKSENFFESESRIERKTPPYRERGYSLFIHKLLWIDFSFPSKEKNEKINVHTRFLQYKASFYLFFFRLETNLSRANPPFPSQLSVFSSLLYHLSLLFCYYTKQKERVKKKEDVPKKEMFRRSFLSDSFDRREARKKNSFPFDGGRNLSSFSSLIAPAASMNEVMLLPF